MSGVDLVTFGCRLNTYESEVMRANAAAAGLEDAVIINTCAVTSEAVRQAGQAIRRVRRERPTARIIVTGCAAQIEPDRFAAMPEVDLVLGNREKLDLRSFQPDTDGLAPRVRAGDIMALPAPDLAETAHQFVGGVEGRVRAFVQVQTGCDHRCTFCIIPFGRGPSVSVPAGEVIERIRALVVQGYREVVLTGVDITSYGQDLPGAPSLGLLVKRILAHVPELERLRLSSLDPVEIDETLIRLLMEEERLMPHVHLSLQAGSDMILKRMKRRHSRADAIALCGRLAAGRPDIAFGADLIAGFPTETEEMFGDTLDAVEACNLTFLHVFPYSARPGTPAARMPQIAGTIVKDRAARLRAAGEVRLSRYLAARRGETVRALMETSEIGRSDAFARVRIEGAAAPGEIVSGVATAVDGDALLLTRP